MERMNQFLAAIAAACLIAISGCTFDDLPMRKGIEDLAASYEWQLSQELHGGNAGDLFGASVAMSDGYAIVGAPGASSAAGAASLYCRTGNSWLPSQTIQSNTQVAGEQFGRYVALSSSVAAVTSSGTGEVELFERSGSAWSYADIASNGGSLGFGSSLDCYEEYVIIGDPSAASYDGLVRVYHKNVTWGSFLITAPAAAAAERFGISVSISGNYAAVGADKHDSSNTDSGMVYIFQKSDTNTWIQVQTLTAADEQANGYFGRSLKLRGDTLIVGERGTSKVHFYTLVGSVWTYEGSCSTSGIVVNDEFGTAVALADGIAATGASGKDSNAGIVYPFALDSSTWQIDGVPLSASGRQSGDYFGQSVAMIDGFILIGAYADSNASGTNAGSAYVYRRVQISGEGAE